MQEKLTTFPCATPQPNLTYVQREHKAAVAAQLKPFSCRLAVKTVDCSRLNSEVIRSIAGRVCAPGIAILITAMLITAMLITATGCGTTRDKMATDQLLLSDAVDRAVAHIDFSPLDGETVFLDTQYIRQVKGSGFVNADYIISSLRSQMVLAGILLQEDRDEATFIVEPRVGALGSDGHDVNYGVPASQGLNAAASIVTGGAAAASATRDQPGA